MPPYEIHTLDLCFRGSPEGIASFLVIGPDGPLLVESGPGSTVPALTRALAGFNLQPGEIRDVLLTHIHLDHGGAAGWWARQGARVHVHHVGAPHLVDPAKLLASAQRIYGDQMHSLWGDFVAVPAEQVRALHDNDVVRAGGLEFRVFDTPGHARHHVVYQIDGNAIAGDLAGVRLSGRPHLRMPTPPPEFELATWQASVERMRAQQFERIYLTHFGAVSGTAAVDAHWRDVIRSLDEYAARARRGIDRGLPRDEILKDFESWEEARMAEHGLDVETRALYAGGGTLGMSVDGLLRYWHKRAENKT